MNDELFSGMAAPKPPADLRARTLRAARAAAGEGAPGARVPWGFRRLDLVWVAALLVLLASNAMLALSRRQPATFMARHAAPAELEERVARPADERDLLALGVRLDPGSAARARQTLTLEQVLREGS